MIEPVDFKPGKLIGKKYKILKRIGHGGTALIYLANDITKDRHVAIKISREDANVSSGLIRFRNEATLLSQFNNNNIIKVIDYIKEKSYEAMIIEYIDGRTLKEIIKSKGIVNIDDSLYYIQQILLALSEIHKKGIFHRDLKPQNIMVSYTNQVKILDFGIAKNYDANDGVTKTGKVVGSVQYLAPEVLKGENASRESDIYSLGMILFELLTGETAFKGDKPAVVAGRIVNEDLPNIQKINPNIDNKLAKIINKSLSKNPSKRYNSCYQMYKDIESYVEQKHDSIELTNHKIDKEMSNETSMVKYNLYKKNQKKFFIVSSLGLLLIVGIMVALVVVFI